MKIYPKCSLTCRIHSGQDEAKLTAQEARRPAPKFSRLFQNFGSGRPPTRSHLTDAMNADAYLRKQGWKGSGHSLDLTGRGIKKPLLIAHKQDQLGLGKKKAAYTTDDQWWMRAYDQSLQSIGTGQEVQYFHFCSPSV